MSQATFIISLDCEAKWGVADNVDRHWNDTLSSANIVKAYTQLTNLLDEFDVPATFAFVACLLISREQAGERLANYLTNPDPVFAKWMSNYLAQVASPRNEGWHVDGLLDIVTHSGRHEIASHGLTHLPLATGAISKALVKREMAESRSILEQLGHVPKTYIFARNQVVHPELLSDFGYIGYRASLAQQSGRSRLQNLLSEFSIFSGAEPHESALPVKDASNICCIPAGQFLNFKMGMRKIVPPTATFLKWRSILNDAASNGTVAHMWFHPHNCISDPTAWPLMRRILMHAAMLRDRGDLNIETQRDFCS